MARSAIWEYQSTHQGDLPNDIHHASELQAIANTLLANAEVNKQVITSMPQDLIEWVCFIRVSNYYASDSVQDDGDDSRS
jgi:hypothetical protein